MNFNEAFVYNLSQGTLKTAMAGKKTINDLTSKDKCDHFPDVTKKGQPCTH